MLLSSTPFWLQATQVHSSTPPVPKAVDKPRNKCPKAHACWAGGVRLKNRQHLHQEQLSNRLKKYFNAHFFQI
jgi:hypothetical protein